MKIQLSFKTPDVVFYALEDVPEEEKDDAKAAIGKFVQYEENVTIEIDTVAGTARVLPR